MGLELQEGAKEADAKVMPKWFLSEEYVGKDKTLMIELPDGEMARLGGIILSNMLLRFLGASDYTLKIGELAQFIYGEDTLETRNNVSGNISHLRKLLTDIDWQVTQLVPKDEFKKGIQGAYKLEKLQIKCWSPSLLWL